MDATGGAYAAIPTATAAVATPATSYPAVSAQPHYSQPGQAAHPTAAATYQYQPAPVTATVIPAVPAPAVQPTQTYIYPSAAQQAQSNSGTNSYANSNSNSNRQTPVSHAETASPAKGAVNGNGNGSGGGVGVAQASRSTSGAFPALPSSFPELEKMSIIQLQRLLTDEVTLEVRGSLCVLLWRTCTGYNLSRFALPPAGPGGQRRVSQADAHSDRADKAVQRGERPQECARG